MLKLCTLISPGERIKNIVGPVTLMSHVGQERITRDITISVSDPSLKASLCHSGGGGGNEQEGYFTMQPMGLGLVIPSLGRS